MLSLEPIEMLEHFQGRHVIQVTFSKPTLDQIINDCGVEIIDDQKSGQVLHDSTKAASFMNLLSSLHQHRFHKGIVSFSELIQFQLDLIDLLDVVILVEYEFPLFLIFALQKLKFFVLFFSVYFIDDP